MCWLLRQSIWAENSFVFLVLRYIKTTPFTLHSRTFQTACTKTTDPVTQVDEYDCTNLELYGYDTNQRGLYKLTGRRRREYTDEIMSCGWIGNCWVPHHLSPDRKQPYQAPGCAQPSWWSCRQGGPSSTGGSDLFNTGRGYFDGVEDSVWQKVEYRCITEEKCCDAGVRPTCYDLSHFGGSCGGSMSIQKTIQTCDWFDSN